MRQTSKRLVTSCPHSLILAVFFSLCLSACATTPQPNPWADLDTETEQAVQAIDCGQFPLPTESSDSGATYSLEGLNQLNAYRVCSESNELNMDEHAAQIGQLKISRKGLTEAGQAQYRISQMLEQIIEQELIETETLTS